jgi:Flp pilus assembly protein TadG
VPASVRDQTKRTSKRAANSGQALVEFAISAALLLILVFGLIDFSRAIYIKMVITNLTGEGSSMASRGTSLAATAAAVVAASAPLNLNASGQVIVSSVFNNNYQIQLAAQVSQGGLGATSLVGNVVGGLASVPAGVIPQLNQTVYVTEVFYRYTSITPIGSWLAGTVLPAQLYDVAYY